MIDISGVSVSFSGSLKPVLDKIDLRIRKGECIMLAGCSGSGKSTLLRAIAGVLPQNATTRGQVSLATTLSRSPSNLGWVHQNPETQLFNLTPFDEIRLSLHLRNPSEATAAATYAILERFGLARKAHLLNRELSSGEQQALVIAAVVARDPEVILMDEPTSFMDTQAIQLFLNAIRKLKQREKTIVFVEHNTEALSVADRLALIDNGAIAYDIPAQPAPPLQILQQFGLAPDDQFLKSARSGQSSEITLLAQNVSFGYGSQPLLHAIDLAIEGSLLHIISGSNGSGKSTLLQLLAGYLSPQSGSFAVNGKRLSNHKRRALSYCLFSMPERQFLTDTVQDELVLGLSRKQQQDVPLIVESLNLSELWNRSIRELSMGQRQRLLIATALLQHRDFLFMDEPTLGMDWRHIQGFIGLLHRYLTDNHTVIMATHHHQMSALFAERTHHLQHGQITTVSGAL